MIGGAASQTMFTGEGYTNTQLAFYNGPETPSFDPFVQDYWNSYIQKSAALNPAINNQSDDMSIWLNGFPMAFDKQISLQGGSFTTNVPVNTSASTTEQTSAALKRDINYNFNQDNSWKYTATATATNSSLSAGTESSPPKDAQGQVISQGIMALFD
jgi:hypothetical protein